MKANRSFWTIPAVFFLVAVGLNVYGKLHGLGIASTVKPALMPLLAVATLAAAGSPDSRGIKLLILAQLLGCVGDTLLLFTGFKPFLGGMVAFLLGHLCYISLFGRQSWKGMGLRTWLPALLVMGGLVAGLVYGIGVEGDFLIPMCVYGMVLMLLIFSGLAGLFRCRENAWWLILAGALLFTFSDACIAMGIFGVMTFALRHFLVMITYLAAQSLLAVGGIRLILGR